MTLLNMGLSLTYCISTQQIPIIFSPKHIFNTQALFHLGRIFYAQQLLLSLFPNAAFNTPLVSIMPGRRRAKGKKHKKRRIHHKNVEQSLPIRMANFHELQMREYYIDTSEKDRFELDELKEFQIKAVEFDFDSPSLPFFRRYQGSLPPVNEEDMRRHFPVFEEASTRQSKFNEILDRACWFALYLQSYLNVCMVHMLKELEESFPKDKAIDKHAENTWDSEA